jgi:hypothetical protein
VYGRSVTIRRNNTGEGEEWTERNFLTAPDAYEYRIDYGDRGSGTAFVECNYANNGQTVLVDYRGGGSPNTWQNLDREAEAYFPYFLSLYAWEQPGWMVEGNAAGGATVTGSYTVPTGVTRIMALLVAPGGGGQSGTFWTGASHTQASGGNGGALSFGGIILTGGYAGAAGPGAGIVGSDGIGAGRDEATATIGTQVPGGSCGITTHGYGGYGGASDNHVSDPSPANGHSASTGEMLMYIKNVTAGDVLTYSIAAPGAGGDVSGTLQDGGAGGKGLIVVWPVR